MTQKVDTEVAEIGIRLLDDAYLAWFSAESECEQALKAWFAGTVETSAKAYCAYRAALDREEAAARDLRRLSELTEPAAEHLLHHRAAPR
jgi:hypothetical protein